MTPTYGTRASGEDGLDPRRLSDALGLRAVVHETVTSTMDVARSDGGTLPAIHLARNQRAGRGRRGRGWASPPGNLYATLTWPDPDAVWPAAVLAAVQLAWAEAIERSGGPSVRCKWPNDGLLDGRKWAGALASRGPGALLVGLGANLTSAPRLPPGETPATALAPRWSGWPGYASAVGLLLEAAVGVLRSGPEALPERLAGWQARDALAPGEPIRVTLYGRLVVGHYRGIGRDGRLLLETADGLVRLAAGEVRRLRPDPTADRR